MNLNPTQRNACTGDTCDESSVSIDRNRSGQRFGDQASTAITMGGLARVAVKNAGCANSHVVNNADEIGWYTAVIFTIIERGSNRYAVGRQ